MGFVAADKMRVRASLIGGWKRQWRLVASAAAGIGLSRPRVAYVDAGTPQGGTYPQFCSPHAFWSSQCWHAERNRVVLVFAVLALPGLLEAMSAWAFTRNYPIGSGLASSATVLSCFRAFDEVLRAGHRVLHAKRVCAPVMRLPLLALPDCWAVIGSRPCRTRTAACASWPYTFCTS